MKQIYSRTNQIKFTEISTKYKVDKKLRSKISELHALVITYVVYHFKDTKKYKQQIVDVLNIITYLLYSGDLFPEDWTVTDPLTNVPDIDDDLLQEMLGDLYLSIDSIKWDVKPTEDTDDTEVTAKSTRKSVSSNTTKSAKSNKTTSTPKSKTKTTSTKKSTKSSKQAKAETPKEDLYIQSPKVPQFDYNKVFIAGTDGYNNLAIYTTLPEIPTKQNEISATTDVTQMRDEELLNLYPKQFIRTRAPAMYEKYDGLDFDEQLGCLLNIGNGKYTREQLIDNIIKYPHIFKLQRPTSDPFVYDSFYSYLEIDGELYSIKDIWKDLDDTENIPFKSEFVKEYVVRRYLLERDIDGIEHKNPFYGSFDSYLTLFMPFSEYAKRGYQDPVELAKQCVECRVRYKQSRNPIIRRLQNV